MTVQIDGTNGITTPTGTGDVSVGDDLLFTGTGNRITGDFSNATIANRVAFQTSTSNSSSVINVLPNGTGTGAFVNAYNNSDPTNAGVISVGIGSTIASLISGINGSGSYLPMTFFTGGSERVRIDTSGNLLVGTTSLTGNMVSIGIRTSYTGNAIVCRPDANNTVNAYVFQNSSGGNAGYIQYNSTTTSYVTSSDYRLKENVAPMTGALEKVAQLNPVTYTWKADGSAGQGFIAHELQAVVPDCVTGEKDAVDDDGNPVYQGVDTSFLVATLTAAIQELKAELDAAKARIELLEAQ